MKYKTYQGSIDKHDILKHWPCLADLCVSGLCRHVTVETSRAQNTVAHHLHTGHVPKAPRGTGVLGGVAGSRRAVVTWTQKVPIMLHR